MDQGEGHQKLTGAMEGVHEDLSIQEAEYAIREQDYDEQYDMDEQLDEIEAAEGGPKLQGYIDIHRTPEEKAEYAEINQIAETYFDGKERGYTIVFNSTGNRAIVWLTPGGLNAVKRRWKTRPLTEEDRFIMGMPEYQEYTDDTMVEVKYPNPNEVRRRDYRSASNPQPQRGTQRPGPHDVDPRSGR
jgi:hypothetical protein